MKIYVADRETGTFIEEVKSVKEGLALIEKYEADDKADEFYKPGWYSVVDEDHCNMEDMTMEAKEIIESGNFEAAVMLMDDEIRESVHEDLAPCSDLEFLAEYMSRHAQRYGEEFTI